MVQRLIMLFCIILFAGCVDIDSLSKAKAFSEEVLQGSGSDKIAVIHIAGIITNTPQPSLFLSRPSLLQEVTAQLRLAGADNKVKAILLVINSPGGSVTASDILYHEISNIQKDSKKPVYALMMDVAASGGYYVALAAKKIVAHPTTITGSIGVIVTRFNIERLISAIGIQVESTKSGAMKDMGSPFKTTTKQEQVIFQNLVNVMNQRFQNLVLKNRKNLNLEQPYKDGRILTAQEALKAGLIDSIGYFDDTIQTIKKEVALEKAKVVTYKRSTIPNSTEYNALAGTSEPSASVIQALQTSAQVQQGFYYLWMPNF